MQGYETARSRAYQEGRASGCASAPDVGRVSEWRKRAGLESSPSEATKLAESGFSGVKLHKGGVPGGLMGLEQTACIPALPPPLEPLPQMCSPPPAQSTQAPRPQAAVIALIFITFHLKNIIAEGSQQRCVPSSPRVLSQP